MDERIRARLHKYAYDLTLDPNTANEHLILSEGNKKVTHVRECQSYPDHLERFECPQVLSRESLNAKSGCCYWEAECSGVDFDIAVTYKGIPRKKRFRGNEFKFNENTWSLNCFHNHFTVWEGYVSTEIHVPSGYFNRVGVYVDVSAGTLSFYSISDTHTLTHIRTFNTTFNEPLYAGFRVCDESSVSLCDIN